MLHNNYILSLKNASFHFHELFRYIQIRFLKAQKIKIYLVSLLQFLFNPALAFGVFLKYLSYFFLGLFRFNFFFYYFFLTSKRNLKFFYLGYLFLAVFWYTVTHLSVFFLFFKQYAFLFPQRKEKRFNFLQILKKKKSILLYLVKLLTIFFYTQGSLILQTIPCFKIKRLRRQLFGVPRSPFVHKKTYEKYLRRLYVFNLQHIRLLDANAFKFMFLQKFAKFNNFFTLFTLKSIKNRLFILV